MARKVLTDSHLRVSLRIVTDTDPQAFPSRCGFDTRAGAARLRLFSSRPDHQAY